jgi:hypothetical protein
MDLYKAISDLHRELEQLNKVISSLEELQRSGLLTSDGRRGRRSMSESERRIVSERMRKYWETRRKQR